MKPATFRSNNIEIGARLGNTLLVLILLGVGFCSVVSAYEKPFWYDEICTVILCRLPSAAAIWKALANAADTNPPVFYFIARIGRQLIPDDHLGYRLPSILGALGTILCLYGILSRRVDRLSALVGASFVLSTPLAANAFEARPYALMLCGVSAAILAWQRIEESRLYSFVLAVALATALSLHYYAILVWPAFTLAEGAVLVWRRRFRADAWIALVVGAVPLFIFSDLLLHLRQYYGQNFWAQPDLNQIFSASGEIFDFGYWSSTLTIGAVLVLLWWSLRGTRTLGSSEQQQPVKPALPIEDCTLTVMLLLLPVVAVVAAKISHGGMTSRYMLPTLLGGALAVGYITSKAAQSLRALLLVGIILNYGLATMPAVKKAVKGSLLERREAAESEGKEILARYQESGLPIVVSSGLQYMPMAYYMASDRNAGLLALVDPSAAVKYSRSDSVDLALVVLRQYFPLHVEDYSKFSSEHREFILISQKASGFDWWPSRLLHEGHSVSLVSVNGGAQVYKVTLKPQSP